MKMNEYCDNNTKSSSDLSGRKSGEVSVRAAIEKRGGEFVPDEETKNSIVSQVRNGVLVPLNPDKEQAVFVLYCVGNDFDTIALKTNFSLDILFVTAAYYDWKTKSSALMSNGKNFSISEIQKDLARTVLVATYMSVQEELGDILSGNKKASKSCALIPKNTAALERLLNTVNQLENPKNEEDSSNSTVYNQNIQINNGQGGGSTPGNVVDAEEVQDPEQISSEEKERLEKREQERKEKFAALRGEIKK